MRTIRVAIISTNQSHPQTHYFPAPEPERWGLNVTQAEVEKERETQENIYWPRLTCTDHSELCIIYRMRYMHCKSVKMHKNQTCWALLSSFCAYCNDVGKVLSTAAGFNEYPKRVAMSIFYHVNIILQSGNWGWLRLRDLPEVTQQQQWEARIN